MIGGVGERKPFQSHETRGHQAPHGAANRQGEAVQHRIGDTLGGEYHHSGFEVERVAMTAPFDGQIVVGLLVNRMVVMVSRAGTRGDLGREHIAGRLKAKVDPRGRG